MEPARCAPDNLAKHKRTYRDRRHQRRIVFIIAFLFLGLFGSAAHAGNLKDAVKDLWGGDGITLADSPPPFPTHAPHFVAASLQGLDALNDAIAPNLNNIAFNSTVTGFTFDIERGVPVRSTESLGPLIAERATTIGAKRLNVVFTYTRLDFTKFNGTDTDDLRLTFAHEDVNGNGIRDTTGPFRFESDDIAATIDLDLKQDVFALISTYGLTRYWDVGFVLPIVHTFIDAKGRAVIVRNSDISARVHNFSTAPGSDQPTDRRTGDETGVGDIILRTKYNFLRKHATWPDLAIRGGVKLNTGDEDDLTGTGDTRFQGLLIASKKFGPVTPHVNFGGQISDRDSDQNNIRYVAGLDMSPHQRVTFALSVVGLWRPGTVIGNNLIDLAPQLKWNVFDTFMVDTFFLIPMNKDTGLRTDFTWTIGAEYMF